MINIVTGGELDLDGINKGGTKFRFSEFSKDIRFNSIGAYEGEY